MGTASNRFVLRIRREGERGGGGESEPGVGVFGQGVPGGIDEIGFFARGAGARRFVEGELGDVAGFDQVGGLVFVEVGGVEAVEVCVTLGVEEDGFGEEAVFKAVGGGAAFAFGSFGAAGLFAVGLGGPD
jgi:hypothetical protein